MCKHLRTYDTQENRSVMALTWCVQRNSQYLHGISWFARGILWSLRPLLACLPGCYRCHLQASVVNHFSWGTWHTWWFNSELSVAGCSVQCKAVVLRLWWRHLPTSLASDTRWCASFTVLGSRWTEGYMSLVNLEAQDPKSSQIHPQIIQTPYIKVISKYIQVVHLGLGAKNIEA